MLLDKQCGSICTLYENSSFCLVPRNASAFATKLSFSDAESLSSSRVHSLAEDSATGSSRLGGLSATLECEKRVKLTREQMKFENQFANNSEVG